MALSVYQFHATSHHDLSNALANLENTKIKITSQGIYFDETSTESSRRESLVSGRNLAPGTVSLIGGPAVTKGFMRIERDFPAQNIYAICV
jgi:hypothetical protein